MLVSPGCYLLILFLSFNVAVADQVTNLREDILYNRVKYALTSLEEAEATGFLQKATRALEK